MLAALPLVLLGWTPGQLSGQQDTTVRLEPGDRVRVWSSEAGWEGREFDVARWSRDARVLLDPDTAVVARVSPARIDRMQLRKVSGDRLWEGALIGGGVGLTASTVLAVGICSGPDYQGGVGCTLDFLFHGLALVGAAPGALLGLMIGSSVPEHEWVAVEVGPAVGRAPPGLSAARGGAVEVRLRVPAVP